MKQAVLHLNELAKWPMLVSNLRNLHKADKELVINAVLNGPAVLAYFSEENQKEMNELVTLGIKLFACEQALKGQHQTINGLPTGVASVPYGVGKLVELQVAGAAYIKV